MNLFVSSDQHFCHKNILKYTDRGKKFATIQEHDAALVSAWNAKVTAKDMVLVVGDFCLSHDRDEVASLINTLNGFKLFVPGSHDRTLVQVFRGTGRDRVAAGATLLAPLYEVPNLHLFDGVKEAVPGIVLCHHPMISWPKSHYGTWLFYGHHHGRLPDQPNYSLDVGVDTSPDYSPYSIQELAAKMKEKEQKYPEMVEYVRRMREKRKHEKEDNSD